VVKQIRVKNWLPLESNPSLMNKYIHSLGVSTEWSFTDVLGLDEGLLQMVPAPCKALLLLFPITSNYERYYDEVQRKIGAKELPGESHFASKGVYFIRQRIGNACGTIGLLHALLNNQDIPRDADKFFGKFYEATKSMDSSDRADALDKCEDIESVHEIIARDSEAKSDVSHPVNDNLHFVALVRSGDELIELDGMKSAPLSHGRTTADTFLADAARVVSGFMARDPADVRFNIVALAPSTESAFN
jgi:ubiquitin carboxyl-terminal hydrolase L3